MVKYHMRIQGARHVATVPGMKNVSTCGRAEYVENKERRKAWLEDLEITMHLYPCRCGSQLPATNMGQIKDETVFLKNNPQYHDSSKALLEALL